MERLAAIFMKFTVHAYLFSETGGSTLVLKCSTSASP